MILDLEPEDFSKDILNYKGLVVIDFWAEWCAPCHAVEPIFEKIANKYQGKAKFARFDVDKAPELPPSLGVVSIPTILIIRNGQVLGRIVGAQSAEKIESQIVSYLNPNG